MNRFYLHEFCLDSCILIDTVKKEWTFYNTNIYGQVYNLDEKPKKITGQRVNGLIKRLNGNYDYFDNYVVDQYVYSYIMTQDQKEKCISRVSIKDKLIAAGDNKKNILETMCKHLLTTSKLSSQIDQEYYKEKIAG